MLMLIMGINWYDTLDFYCFNRYTILACRSVEEEEGGVAFVVVEEEAVEVSTVEISTVGTTRHQTVL